MIKLSIDGVKKTFSKQKQETDWLENSEVIGDNAHSHLL